MPSMDELGLASDALCRKLEKSLELMGALTSVSREKETCLVSGDIETLRAATEREEDMVAELGMLEKDREVCADALSGAAGISGRHISLSELIAVLPDDAARRRLSGLKDALGSAVAALTAQNDKLSALLAQRINYTTYMLNLLYIPKSKNHTYDVQGSRRDGGVGTRNFFDLHV